MSKITGKFQITLPKRLVDQYALRVGDEIELIAAGETISLAPARKVASPTSAAERIRQFDLATERQRRRERGRRLPPAKRRGWAREDLYTGGRTR